MYNILEKLGEFQAGFTENVLEWDPQLLEPSADAPVYELSKYNKDVAVAVCFNYLSHAYGIDDEVEQPQVAEQEPQVPEAPRVPTLEAKSFASGPDEDSDRVINIADARALTEQAINSHPSTELTTYDLPKAA